MSIIQLGTRFACSLSQKPRSKKVRDVCICINPNVTQKHLLDEDISNEIYKDVAIQYIERHYKEGSSRDFIVNVQVVDEKDIPISKEKKIKVYASMAFSSEILEE